MVDGKLIKDYGLYEVERTAAVSKRIEAGALPRPRLRDPKRLDKYGGREDSQTLRRLSRAIAEW